MAHTFDPTRHFMTLKGKDYLEVKWRLVWLRSQHPTAHVETELVKLVEGAAIFRATVTLPPLPVIDPKTGEVLPGEPWSGKATGYGMCGRDEFGDYLERAETAALGRALAALGFGTQFAGAELDGRIVDSPVERQQGQQPRQQQGGDRGEPAQRVAPDAAGSITDPQRRKLFAMARAVYGMEEAQLRNWIIENHQVEGDQLSRRAASGILNAWEEDANKN